MSAKDLVATIGTYEKDGQKKYLSRKVGTMIETKNGPRMKLDASFNPAGCPRDEDGSIWIAIFDQKPRDARPAGQAAAQDFQAPSDDFNDDIPF